MNINKGDAFLCIKDFEMKDGTIAFKKGLIYTSERKDCITNEWKNKDHFMNKFEPFSEYFRDPYEPVPTSDTKELLKRILELRNEN
jgi:hypothetical protein